MESFVKVGQKHYHLKYVKDVHCDHRRCVMNHHTGMLTFLRDTTEYHDLATLFYGGPIAYPHSVRKSIKRRQIGKQG